MTSTGHIVVLHIDDRGNFWRETLSTNAALLRVLRFLRQHPDGACSIELRESAAVSPPAPDASLIASLAPAGVAAQPALSASPSVESPPTPPAS